jgi:ribose/xylose/arabinose/galactoside ABC-type transport system permease subunit
MVRSTERVSLFFVEQIAWIVVAISYLGFAVLRPHAMLNLDTLSFLVYSSVHLGFIVLAESVCLFTGNFDLSVADQVAFISMATGVILMNLPRDSPLAAILSVTLPFLVGAFCGSINGALVGKAGLNPFIVTLGTSVAFRGASLLIHPQSIWRADLPPFFIEIGANQVTAIILFATVLVILWFFFKYTRLGTYIYAVGGDRETSRMLGISVENTIFTAYVIAGILSGFATLAYAGFNKGIPINVALGAIFPAFAGAVIGGVSLLGGRGSVVNAFAGALLIGTLHAGLTMFAVSPDARRVAFGTLVVGAIVLDRSRNKLRDAILRPKK